MSNQYLSFDVTKQSTPQELIIGRQGDSQLKFVTMLFWDGDKNIPYDLTGKQVAFEALKPDNTHIVDYEGITILDAPAGLVRYSFNEQVFSVAGTMQQAFFKITHTDGDNNVIADSTLEVAINILENRVEFGINSKDYLSEYDDLIAQVKKKFDDYAATVQDSIDKAQALHDQIVQYTNLINSNGVILRSDFGDISSIKQPLGKTFVDKLNNEFNDRGVNVKWYGAKGDGNTHLLSESYASIDEAKKDYPAATSLADTKDWCAITEAIKEGQNKGLSICLAPGNYFVNKTVTLPTGVAFYGAYQNSKICASSQMSEDSKNAPLAILEYDDAGQPPIYIESIQVVGTNDKNNQLIGLHLGGNRASKISNFIVNNCFGHGTLVHPTHPQSADVENITFEHYWQVQSGSFCIKSNASIDRGNITDFTVYDSQITTLDVHDKNQSNTSSPAVEIINEDNKNAVKTVYGIEFTRCFLHAQGNNLVRVVGNHAPRATHSINFDFIKGELHDVHGDLGSGSDKFFLFHLENCRHVMVDHSSQLIYSGASYVEMKCCAFCDIQTAGVIYLGWLNNDSMIFTLDKYSYENHINLIGMDIYLAPGSEETVDNPNYGYDFGQAHDAMDLFTKMKDEGSDNHITGWQIGQTLTLNNEPQRLAHITNGKIDGLSDDHQSGVTSSLIPNSVHTKHVIAKGTVGPLLALPIPYKRTSGFLISFRAIGSEDDLKKLMLIAGSQFVQVPTDQNWHVWTGICKTNILNAIGIQATNSGILSNDVTLEIEYLDCFMENKIPYYPDFIALPMPTPGEGNY